MNEIRILGGGCPKCNKLTEMAQRAVEELGVQATVVHVSDPVEIARMTMITPAMAIGDKLVIVGLKPYNQVKDIIARHLQ